MSDARQQTDEQPKWTVSSFEEGIETPRFHVVLSDEHGGEVAAWESSRHSERLVNRAERIATAVNSHAALVEAAEGAFSIIRKFNREYYGIPQNSITTAELDVAIAQLESALHLARAEWAKGTT